MDYFRRKKAGRTDQRQIEGAARHTVSRGGRLIKGFSPGGLAVPGKSVELVLGGPPPFQPTSSGRAGSAERLNSRAEPFSCSGNVATALPARSATPSINASRSDAAGTALQAGVTVSRVPTPGPPRSVAPTTGPGPAGWSFGGLTMSLRGTTTDTNAHPTRPTAGPSAHTPCLVR
jgi:hypothetical protein